MRKPVKRPSKSKTSSRAAPAKRVAATKVTKSSASKAKAAESKTAKTKPVKTKKSAKAKPAKKTAAVSPNAKGCCVIKYTDGSEEARNGLTQQQCHDIEISSQAVAATHWQVGVCA